MDRNPPTTADYANAAAREAKNYNEYLAKYLTYLAANIGILRPMTPDEFEWPYKQDGKTDIWRG